MNFRTEINIAPAGFQLSLQSQILTIGSCFADVMGARLLSNKFNILVNPFGVIYNPLSILKLVQTTLDGTPLSKDLLWQYEGQWYHFDLHSEVSAGNENEFCNKISALITKVHTYLITTDVLFLTLGTAFVYRWKETGNVVANCHKAPAHLFTKELLSVSEATQALILLYKSLTAFRPDLHIILTLSPVRHTRDGIPENQVSKSVLRVACHEAASQCPQISYFPAYECMLDDLRDYRFYKKDMIHPSEVAEEYIWRKFVYTYLDQEAQTFIKEWEGITKSLAHKPFHPQSEAYLSFLRKTRDKLIHVSRYVDTAAELQQLEEKLSLQSHSPATNNNE